MADRCTDPTRGKHPDLPRTVRGRADVRSRSVWRREPPGRGAQTGRVTDVFSGKLAAWREYTESPWARIRYGVVSHVLQRHASELGSTQLRVLDVGGGDGMDAIPLAKAGHAVTILDPSPSWLLEAERRASSEGTEVTTVEGGLDGLDELDSDWDLVLCHFVLRYRPESGDDVARLARRLRPGGRLSVMDVNPDGRVLRELLNSGPAAASAELRAARAKVETFATDARKVSAGEVRDDAEKAQLRTVGLYGNRIANDLLVDNTAKYDDAFFAELLSLELELCDREPFNRVGFAWQYVFEQPAW